MAERGLKIIDKIVIEEMNGTIDKDNWIIPLLKGQISKDQVDETFVPWQIIEDSDQSWTLEGFQTKENQWNASGATLTFGNKNCKADISFEGTAVQYYAFRSPKGGNVQVILDGKDYGKFCLKDDSSKYGQHYIKIFEKFDLEPKKHTLQIIGDADESEKTIDMVSIIPLAISINK